MAMLGPISVSSPSPLSTAAVTGVVGTMGGVLGAEYLSSSLISATKMTGDGALGVGLVAKGAAGAGLWYIATKLSGSKAKMLAWTASIGSFAGMGLDLIHRAFPVATAGLSAKLGMPTPPVAAMLAISPVVPTAPAPATAVTFQ